MYNKSKQRDAILSILKSTTSHPSAEWIYSQVKHIIPNISLGTVYRNLGILLERGDIIKVQGTFSKDRYDGNPNRHIHLVCNQCGGIFDIGIKKNLDNALINIDTQAKVEDFSLTYYGICPYCNK